MPKSWLAVGSPKNWERALEQGNLWGLKEPHRMFWETVEKGDRLFLYASTPVGGIVGVANVVNKLRQTRPLWQEEIEQGRVIYPLLVEFDIEYVLPFEAWKTDRLVNETIKARLKFRQTFQIVEDTLAAELLGSSMPATASVQTVPEKPTNLHDQAIEDLVRAGKLQKFIAEKEYDMEGAKLDAVWRRVERAVPAYVFEVQIGGNLYQAMSKLKHASDIWNSNIFLVIQGKDRGSVDKLLAGTFHEIRDKIKVMEVTEVAELRKRKEGLRDLEKGMGLL